VEKNLCVLIDFENIAAGTEKDGLGRFDVKLVLERLADKGRVLIARSYADWGRFARFKQGLLTANVNMMELTSHGMQDKNRADIALVVEGMELAFTKPYIDTFVVVSGDSDFTPMVLKMRELDKRVIGCGCRSSTSRLLIQACDEFIFYDNLAKRKKSRTAKKQSRRSKGGEPSLEDALELLTDTLEGLQRENPDPPHASVVKSAMLRKSPDFNEGDLGFSSLARFLERARKAGKVTLIRDEKSGGYRVDQPNGGNDDGDSGSKKGPWLDPYLPKGSEKYVEVLAAEGLNPLAAPTRKAVLQCLEEVVAHRNKRKRRNTVHFVQDDVTKRMRKTHPDLPAKGIRNVFNGLMRANAFIHRDGNPVRTGSAPFSLQKKAEELNETLTDIYVYELIGNGVDLDVKLLADLFLGDASRTRPIEESIAYHQANAEDDDEGDDAGDAPDLDEVDVDSLLLEETDDDEVDDDEKKDEDKKASTKKKSASKSRSKSRSKSKKDEDTDDDDKDDKDDKDETPKKKATSRKRTSSRKKTSKKDTAKDDDSDGTVTADSDDKADDAPKKTTRKRSTRKKSTAKKADAKTEDTDADDTAKEDEAKAEDKPKKPTRRRTRKKKSDVKADKEEADSSDDLDALLSED